MAVRDSLEADRMWKLREAVIFSLGLQENSDVREEGDAWARQCVRDCFGVAGGGGGLTRVAGFLHFLVFLGLAWAWRCCSLPLPTFVRDPHTARGPRRAEHAAIGDLAGGQRWRRGPGLHAEKGRGQWAAF